MIVNDLRPRGYCHGVARALKMVKKAVTDDTVQKPIYILGLIVHNKKIKEAFEHLGVKSLDLQGKTRVEAAKTIKDGTVILTAHGVADEVKMVLTNNQIPYIDATCMDVYKVHNHVKEHLPTHEVLYIGKPLHPEVEGVLGLSDEITLISNIDEAIGYVKKTQKPIYITNQTTLSHSDVKRLVDEIRKRYDVLFDQDICMATTLRQQAVIEQPKADVLIVIGDTLSSNTNKLKSVSLKENNIPTYLIETLDQINPEWFKGVSIVNVTSGASTPTVITNEVIRFLKQFDYDKKETWDHVSRLTYLDILS